MQKMSKALKKAFKEGKPQITNQLVRIRDGGEIVGYCALGMLQCAQLGFKDADDYSKRRFVDQYAGTVQSYGVPSDLLWMDYRDELGFDAQRQGISAQSLYWMIVTLNDYYKLNFKEIGEFLETNLGL